MLEEIGNEELTPRLAEGTIIAERYEIVRPIGRGGMANVYLAKDAKNNTRVALKVLNSDLSKNLDYVRRFIREVQLMQVVDHPNVVKTFAVGSDKDLIYLTMEFVPGNSLEILLRRNSFSKSDIPELISQICSGLQAIHDAEIIHRDLKPGNILVTQEGNIKITDFGVARPKESNLTRKNQKVGSVLYMAPEVWAGHKLTPAVDYYSLGIMLYEVATGKSPFRGSNPGEMMNLHLRQTPTPPKEVNPELPRWLNSLIIALLEKSPRARPSSAENVMSYLGRNTASSPSIATVKQNSHKKRRAQAPVPPSLWRRHKKTIGTLAMGMAAAGLIVVLLLAMI